MVAFGTTFQLESDFLAFAQGLVAIGLQITE